MAPTYNDPTTICNYLLKAVLKFYYVLGSFICTILIGGINKKLFQRFSECVDCCLPEVLSTAGVSRHSCVLTDAKTRLYVSGVLDHCVHILSLDPRSLRGSWSSVSTLAQLTRWVRFNVRQNVSVFNAFEMGISERVCPAPAALGSSLASVQRPLTGFSCRHSWTASSH